MLYTIIHYAFYFIINKPCALASRLHGAVHQSRDCPLLKKQPEHDGINITVLAHAQPQPSWWKSIIVNQEWRTEHFSVITDNEALEIEIELQNGKKVILATIYCPNGNPSLRLFKLFNALSLQVIFHGDFRSKLCNLDLSNQTNLIKRLLT